MKGKSPENLVYIQIRPKIIPSQTIIGSAFTNYYNGLILQHCPMDRKHHVECGRKSQPRFRVAQVARDARINLHCLPIANLNWTLGDAYFILTLKPERFLYYWSVSHADSYKNGTRVLKFKPSLASDKPRELLLYRSRHHTMKR